MPRERLAHSYSYTVENLVLAEFSEVISQDIGNDLIKRYPAIPRFFLQVASDLLRYLKPKIKCCHWTYSLFISVPILPQPLSGRVVREETDRRHSPTAAKRINSAYTK